MIDSDGFRFNIGIILTNKEGKLFWGRRVGQDAWQFPQGGMQNSEEIEQALFRELHEEVGLNACDVKIIAKSQNWLKYRLPSRLVRPENLPLCIGQKQKWFLLRLEAQEENINLDLGIKPEFDGWRWVNYWYPLSHVVAFKREVYRRVLIEFAPIMLKKEIKEIELDPLE